ncbi:fumarylacetoacetate hydrolase family protein [Methylobacterium nonmethylotrophicum]|uniref:FAA hydrolase family protein n=1 Tax=Methylobacterium nonmethylotrophicum TaxID=1141884 RepID=A0A4Z0NMH7_9HYPH|nr:fumarylacetoacetate hydrolase family protein [Methylobacterium nonmethylotrophicum]TGD96989.1 FAA hydrolase family protein [Methylobacterium nonmethylotrophicum]
MKFVTFESGGAVSYGLWQEEGGRTGVVDLGRRLPYPTLDALIAAEAVAEAAAFAGTPPDHAAGAVRLRRPLSAFRKCFCVGVNYPDRNAEYKDASDLPPYPSLFIRFPESFSGPDAPILRPPESRQLDYEGEIVLVIGRAGRRIRAADWRDHVMGYTLANEGTLRDWVRHGKFNVTPGKNWASSGSLGPWIVTADAVDAERLRLVTRVNGEVRQDDTTARLMFPFGRILEYVSTFCTLEPGDIILTGTPAGAGARFDPPRFLVPGDVVEVEVGGIGLLRNTVADEAP